MAFRRSDLNHEILNAQLTMILTCVHELQQYGLYLKSAPASAACLALPDAPTRTIKMVLRNLENEWRTVEKMEATNHGRACLNQHCRYATYQQYREILMTWTSMGGACTRRFLRALLDGSRP